MRHRTSLAAALLFAALADQAGPFVTPARKPEPVPRRFTDARKAEAQAKRERKAAKRLK